MYDDAMDADSFHDFLDSIEALDAPIQEGDDFQIIILIDHTYILSKEMWELLTIHHDK